MPKMQLKPHTALAPVPVVLVSCATKEGKHNIVTVAWAGTVCSDPPQIAIGLRPQRFSHQLIADTGEFVVNMPTQDQAEIVDHCGMVSGREQDKFAACKLTALKGSQLRYAPLIAECPVNLECRVVHTLALGSHDLFIAEIVAVHADAAILNPQQRVDHAEAQPMAYVGSTYYSLGAVLGSFGYSKRNPFT